MFYNSFSLSLMSQTEFYTHTEQQVILWLESPFFLSSCVYQFKDELAFRLKIIMELIINAAALAFWKSTVLWNVIPCSLVEVNEHFGEI
jgi:hypothetical protein